MPYSPHKFKSIYILTTLVLMGFPPHSFSAETTNYQGYYPVPFVATDEFRLLPRNPATMAINCEMGTIYINSTTNELTVCGINNAKSKEIWEQAGYFVYPNPQAPYSAIRKISVGNDAAPPPPAAFNVLGPLVALPLPLVGSEQNEFNIDLLNNTTFPQPPAPAPPIPPIITNSAGMSLKQDGIFTAPNRNTSIDINFHVGNRGQDYDGRILYMNKPKQGFAFFGAYITPPAPPLQVIPHMWIDQTDHQVGIGTNIPTQRLEIIGDIETNEVILDQDGTLGANLPAELKVSYSPVVGSEGYYAVYAP